LPRLCGFPACDVKEMLEAPFRVFGIAARTWALPTKLVLFWNRLLVQSIEPVEVSPCLLR
jgi:hypothetical protein